MSKTCGVCKVTKPINKFYSGKNTCKECILRVDHKTEVATPPPTARGTIAAEQLQVRDAPPQIKPLIDLMNGMLARITVLEAKCAIIDSIDPRIVDILTGKTKNPMFEMMLGGLPSAK